MNGFIFKPLLDIALATKNGLSLGCPLLAHLARLLPSLYGGKNGLVLLIGLNPLNIGLPCINGAYCLSVANLKPSDILSLFVLPNLAVNTLLLVAPVFLLPLPACDLGDGLFSKAFKESCFNSFANSLK